MPRQVTELSVFVASPSDVEEEVARLVDVIERLNLEWSSQGIRLRLVRWKTDANPDFGPDPQSVINQQIGPDHDIFIGLLWGRLGTPTGRAESGTVEEFRRAKQRHDEDPDSVALMLYFKETPIPPSQIDAEQFGALQEFRSQLGEEGGLYWTFEDTAEFERTVHMHLARFLLRNRPPETHADAAVGPSVVDGPVHDGELASHDEPGLLDLQEAVETEFAGLNETATELAAATTKIGEFIAERAADLKRAQQRSDFNAVRRKVLRNVSDHAAVGLDRYVEDVESILPRFLLHLDGGVAAFATALPVQGQISKGTADERKQLKKAVSKLRGGLANAASGADEFKRSLENTPGMTIAMNRSRRAAARILQRQISAMRRAELELAEVESLVDDWLVDEE